MGLGLALARPDSKVMVLDCDATLRTDLGGLATIGESKPVLDVKIIERRIHCYIDGTTSMIRFKQVPDDLEIHHQRIWRNIVGTQGLPVESTRIIVADLEPGIVQ